MKKCIFFIVALGMLLISSCNDNFSINAHSENAEHTGFVKVTNINGRIELSGNVLNENNFAFYEQFAIDIAKRENLSNGESINIKIEDDISTDSPIGRYTLCNHNYMHIGDEYKGYHRVSFCKYKSQWQVWYCVINEHTYECTLCNAHRTITSHSVCGNISEN